MDSAPKRVCVPVDKFEQELREKCNSIRPELKKCEADIRGTQTVLKELELKHEELQVELEPLAFKLIILEHLHTGPVLVVWRDVPTEFITADIGASIGIKKICFDILMRYSVRLDGTICNIEVGEYWGQQIMPRLHNKCPANTLLLCGATDLDYTDFRPTPRSVNFEEFTMVSLTQKHTFEFFLITRKS